MCSVSTNGERARLSADKLSFFFTILDKHTNILVTFLPLRTGSYQCSYVYTYIGWLLALRLSVDRYLQILHIYTHVNSYILMPYTVKKSIN